jgi:hypothetical protein
MGAALAVADRTTQTIPTQARQPQTRGWLPAEILDLVCDLETGTSITDLARFERRLADYFDVDHVLCVWMNWPRRVAWSTAGVMSSRLQELIPEVAGSGRRIVLPNAILEPIGVAPSCGALVVKGATNQVLQPHVLRLIARIAARIAPSLERLIAL